MSIPTAEPQIRNANDWYARFETVKSTFSSRVGQISNAALDRNMLAYDESLSDEIREQNRKETETLAILTGLEIDSALSPICRRILTARPQGEAGISNTSGFLKMPKPALRGMRTPLRNR